MNIEHETNKLYILFISALLSIINIKYWLPNIFGAGAIRNGNIENRIISHQKHSAVVVVVRNKLAAYVLWVEMDVVVFG